MRSFVRQENMSCGGYDVTADGWDECVVVESSDC